MNSLTNFLLSGGCALGLAVSASAAGVSVGPSQTIGVGTSTTLSLFVNDLTASAHAVGSYDFDLTFDPGILTIDSVIFGS
jgi:hypothetical protein